MSVCMPCPSGRYCSSFGSSTPQGGYMLVGTTTVLKQLTIFVSMCVCQGLCLQGFFCQGGATDPAPLSSNTSLQNGPCPLGHYCPAGCIFPIPCPLGSMRNATGTHYFRLETYQNVCIRFDMVIAPVSGGWSMESCFSCPAGQYCSTEGLAGPSGPCAAGFYCPFDFTSTTPYAFLCPKVNQNELLLLFLYYSMLLFL